MLRSVRRSVCLFHTSNLGLGRGLAKMVLLCISGHYRTLVGNPMLEVESLDQRWQYGHRKWPKVRNGNKTVAGADSEAFARWLHRRYAAVECHFAARYFALCEFRANQQHLASRWPYGRRAEL